MKYNKVSILALTGLILAVLASGTAFASTTYGGTFTTNYGPTTGSVTPMSYSSGNVHLSVGSPISWSNTLNNKVTGRSVTGYAGGLTSPLGGFANNEQNSAIGANNVYSPVFSSTIVSTGPNYQISAYQDYKDGVNQYSAADSVMSYYN